MNITEIDSNFKIPDDVQREDLVWHDVRTAPVSIYGLSDPTDASATFHRFPFDVGEVEVQVLGEDRLVGQPGTRGAGALGDARPLLDRLAVYRPALRDLL